MPNRAAAARAAVLRAGAGLPARWVRRLSTMSTYLELGSWAEAHAEPGGVRHLPDKQSLFALARSRVSGQRPLYLEFGVYQGESFRWWLQNLRTEGARFVGFDSFEGLPEDWESHMSKGHFKTGGPPQVDDPRAEFVVGWFDETVPGYQPPEHDMLIVNVDSDLYSSAATVLSWLERVITGDTLVYFDELPDRDHEMRALLESQARGVIRWTAIAAANGGYHWLFLARPAAG